MFESIRAFFNRNRSVDTQETKWQRDFKKYYPAYAEYADPGFRSRIDEASTECLLTVKAGDYAASRGKTLEDYSLAGVSADCTIHAVDWLPRYHARRLILNRIRGLGAEVVVDIRATASSNWGAFGMRAYSYSLVGTALIPKKTIDETVR